MAFSPNIPTVTDPILQSFKQLRANFQGINESFADNHQALTNDLEFAGMHDLLTMRPQSGDPTTSAVQIALYNKLVTAIPELFFRPSSNQTPIQLTYPSIKTDSSTAQYTFMAGPFVVYGGLVTSPASNQTVILSPTTTLVYVGLTVTNSKRKIGISTAIPTNIVGSSFDISFQGTPSLFDVYYLAIGI